MLLTLIGSLGKGFTKRSTLTGVADLQGVRKLTALDGKDGEVMNRVGLSVERLSCADDPTKSVHVKEPLQVCVSVNGVPG